MSGRSVDILRSATQDDMVIKIICKFVEAYWPNRIDTNYKPYDDKRDELSLEYSCAQGGLLFQRVHADFAGLVDGEMYLVMVCAMTKWPEV
ncbi:hypothetical protein GJ496_006950 [Pomphorhynchus laevis]|nr:hypothetical protein GJ496_006950 [Pomphorhynchus laevis]